MTTLVFEKVGDINSTYPYLYVYDDRDKLHPFMEIAVSDMKTLSLTLFPSACMISLTLAQWDEIRERAAAFLSQVLADEVAFQQYENLKSKNDTSKYHI